MTQKMYFSQILWITLLKYVLVSTFKKQPTGQDAWMTTVCKPYKKLYGHLLFSHI